MSGTKVPVEETAFRGVWYGCGTENTLPGHAFVYAGGKATYSAWHRPVAIYAPEVKRTFFVFGDERNRPAISHFDHRTERFAAPLALGVNPDGNAHRNPTLLIHEEGFLYVFYGYAGGGQPIHVLRSDNPHDITQWHPCTDLTDGDGSYAQPWQLNRGKIFVAHRIPTGWCFKTTSDGGKSWSEAVSLVAFGDYEFCSTVYGVTVAENGAYPRKIHLAWSKLGGGSPDSVRTKPLWARRFNVYYACSNDGGRTWRKSNGASYSLPITEETAEGVYDSDEHGVWLKDIQLDPEGNPCILFVNANTDTYASTWKVARHANGGWTVADVTVSDHMYDGGALVLGALDDFRMFGPTTPVQPGCDGGEIEEWQSSDQGRTWEKTAHVTTASTYSHNHVKAVFGQERSDGRFRVFWSYGDAKSPPGGKNLGLFYWGDGMKRGRPIAVTARPGAVR